MKGNFDVTDLVLRLKRIDKHAKSKLVVDSEGLQHTTSMADERKLWRHLTPLSAIVGLHKLYEIKGLKEPQPKSFKD